MTDALNFVWLLVQIVVFNIVIFIVEHPLPFIIIGAMAVLYWVVSPLAVSQPKPRQYISPEDVYETANRVRAEKVLIEAEAERDDARSRAQMAKAHREDTQTFLKTRHRA
jgi:hypothetical protein